MLVAQKMRLIAMKVVVVIELPMFGQIHRQPVVRKLTAYPKAMIGTLPMKRKILAKEQVKGPVARMLRGTVPRVVRGIPINGQASQLKYVVRNMNMVVVG